MSEATASDTGEKYEADVFLVHSERDEATVKQIYYSLTKHGLRCAAQFDHKLFTPGEPIFDCITASICKSWRTVLVLTKNSMNSSWINLETILALEQSQSRRNKDLSLRVLLLDVKEDEVPILKHGDLSVVPHLTIDFNKRNWEKRLKASLEKHIDTSSVLPVGSLAHGLVFSHYTGYSSYVLPRIHQLITEKSTIYKEKPDKVSLKYYMLVPESCVILDDLAFIDQNSGIIIEKQEILPFNEEHMGKVREFRPTLFKIKKVWEEYYFFADFPNVLNAIRTLEDKDLADIHIPSQRDRFFHTYNKLVNHAENVECHETLEIISYDDAKHSHCDVLFKAVKRDCRKRRNEANLNRSVSQSSGDQTPSPNSDISVFITCGDGTDDRDIAAGIHDYLKNNGINVLLDEGRHEREEIARNCRWHIFIFSKDALKSGTFTKFCCDSLSESLNVNHVKVLPILKDVPVGHVPRFINWVSLLSVDEPNYCRKILQTIKGGDVKMEHRMPAGDVVTGLVWAYFINYLAHTLLLETQPENGSLDLRQRIQKFLGENDIKFGCIYKLYIICPRTCEPHHNVQDKANEGLENEERVKYLGNLVEVNLSTGGQIGRPFKLPVFKYTNQRTGRTICFITEYCTPMGCLHLMATRYAFGGLHKAEMYEQGQQFVTKFEELASRQAVKENLGDFTKLVKLISYDDERQSLITALEKQIGFDDVRDTEIVYQQDIVREGDQINLLPSIAQRDEVYEDD